VRPAVSGRLARAKDPVPAMNAKPANGAVMSGPPRPAHACHVGSVGLAWASLL